ncbi:MAG: DEAD/DEAH box helicase [Thermoplasmata archaeon]|nr:DEAD/DEAH box helicase [Thermoplasmata archaeon]
MYIKHQMIVPDSIEERHYQVAISESSMKRSTLVVLPTGLGKTIIALMVVAETLRTRKGKILFLAPTKPLVEQHARFLRKHLISEPPAIFTGELAPAKRKELWSTSQIIAATPQVISNDLVSGQIDLNEVSLIVFDEAHRATGDYAYVFIGERYQRVKSGHRMGMTASPGNDPEKILEVCENLGIEGVEIRHEYDPDVVRYVHEIYLKWIEMEVPEALKKVILNLKKALDEEGDKLRKTGYLKRGNYVSTKDLLQAQRVISGQMQVASPGSSAFSAATSVAIAMKINHALELGETQGVAALKAYFERLTKDAVSRGASRASKETIMLPKVQVAMNMVKVLDAQSVESPKLGRVKKLVVAQLNQKPDSRIIVFTHYRDTCELVADELAKISIIKPARFVGQTTKGSDKGMNQKKQVDIIDRFQAGEFNVLVATSVAEEGLDIPSTDLVIFYEPVPSEIRSIQRRGRTGRHRAGKVFILISKGTRDEAYYWSSRHKESRMHRELEKLRKDLQSNLTVGGSTAPVFESGARQATRKSKPWVPEPEENGQKTLGEFGKKKPKEPEPAEPQGEKLRLIADTREFKSPVVRHLAVKDVIIESRQLDVGDYLVSERVGVERKEIDDLMSSIMDGRLFQQVKALKRAYQVPLIIIEGEGLYTRRLSADAIRGALASITVDFGVPIMFTANDMETAEFLLTLLKREVAEGRTPGIRGEKGTMLIQERQQFILEGLPNISGTMAQRLLSHFGSVKAVLDASEKELIEVNGVGKVIAKGIREAIEAKYYSKEREEEKSKKKKSDSPKKPGKKGK